MALEEYSIEMSPQDVGKWCSKCGEFKAWAEFSKSKRDGYVSRCKACERGIRARYYADNRDKVLERSARYYADNRDEARGVRARYQADNRDKARERSARYYAENTDNVRKRVAQYQADNPDKKRAKDHRRRARKRAAEGTHTAAEMREQFTRQKGVCYYCDCKLIHPFEPKPKTTVKRVAHWEHIIPLARGGRNSLDNLVWACANCNLSKNDKLLGVEWKAPNGRMI